MDTSNLSLKATISIIILIIFGVIIFALGSYAGIAYQSQKSGEVSVLSGSNTSNLLASNLKSELVGSILLFGKVENISGKTVKISKGGTTIPVLMTDDAEYVLMDYTSKAPIQRKATLGDLKVGDNLSVGVKLLENNSFSGKTATIYPSGNKNIK